MRESMKDPLIDNAAFAMAIADLGQVDNEMNQYFLDEGNLRHFLAYYLDKIAQPSKGN